jgi:protein subunit release factor B
MRLPTQIFERLARLDVELSDIDERFVRGAGPGGQKINKTSSTVCLRHNPSGTEVRCQAERSQSANRLKAWETLCQKLESRVRAAELASKHVSEAKRRQTRPKTKAQKIRMIQSKKHRSRHKATRKRVNEEA